MVRVVIRADMTKAKEAIRRWAIGIAKREHAKVLAAEPQPSGFSRYVDGVEGASEETVRAGGNIIYQYDRVGEVIDFALATLKEISPRLTGAYQVSHTLFINGKPAASADGAVLGEDDIAISNLRPYARKIEVGKMQMTVPGTDQVFQRARQQIMARFGNQVDVRFTYRGIIGLGSGTGTLVNPQSAKGRAHNRASVRFPTLVFRPAGSAPRRRTRRKP